MLWINIYHFITVSSWSYLLDTVKTMLPPKAWNSLSPDLYATFWGLTLYDLYVPKNRYESEIAKLHANLKSLEELSDNSSSAITKRKKEKERIQESLDRLISELHKHEENVASVHSRLSREKDRWLSSCPDTLKINMEFLQRCIFPRCTFSMPDAVYCAMFVHTLHSLGTPFFNTVNHIDVLICKTLQPMICCCTEYEAGRLGRFLYETLKIAYYWKVMCFYLQIYFYNIFLRSSSFLMFTIFNSFFSRVMNLFMNVSVETCQALPFTIDIQIANELHTGSSLR